jgi:adenine-specific DNA-methyltransferase
LKKFTDNDPETKSLDVVTGNLERLKALFPELITEGANGPAINIDVLKQLVGDKTLTDAEEKYGLNWHGKRAARQLALTPSAGTLRPCQEDSVNWDATQNIMIEGDNLEVLKLLQKSYAGKVKLIYIDPPYNTGKDFVYPDDFKDNIKNYLELTGQAESGRKISSNTDTSGRFHTDWLNMIYPRLRVARDLLRQDGVLAISIDQHELMNLRSALADIFGDDNIVNTLCWVNNLKGRQISNHGAALTHEYVLVCSRNQDLVEEFTVQVEWAKSRMPSAYRGFNYEVLTDAKGEYVLKNQLYNTNSAFNEATRPNLVFNIHFNPKTAEVRTTAVDDPQLFEGFHVIRPHRCNDGTHKYHAWRWGRQKVEQESDDLAFIVTGASVKVFTKVRGHASTVLKDLLTDIATNEGQRDIEQVLGTCPFQYPKPLALMQLLVQAVSTAPDSDIVMDFFAGSGTTGHAVMAQNVVDGGNRRYVLVQLPEPLDPEDKDQAVAAEFCDKLAKPRTIAELTKERLRRAAKKIKDENPQFSGDLGLRVFKLDSSNIRAWEPDRDNLDETLIAHAEHLKADRTEQDILYELLLKLGLDLCVPMETKSTAEKDVHSIGGGVLLACLATKITREEVEPLAQGFVAWHKKLAPAGDTTCVFRDSAFVDDVAKTNMSAILSQHGMSNVRSL